VVQGYSVTVLVLQFYNVRVLLCYSVSGSVIVLVLQCYSVSVTVLQC
jgi:hypothetical protein